MKLNNLKLDIDIQNNSKLLKDSINHKSIMVIGGAGTIGSNYIKQILNFKPKKITVVDINENGLTELTRDLRSSALLDYDIEYLTYPINLLDETFDKLFINKRYDIIANFAAHKHVRSEKDRFSIEALIRNNVFGAIKLLNICKHHYPEYFFSVSTDKAANPVNVMGASKLIMEKIILSNKDNFRVSTARFANVAFSNGSLLHGFINRINNNQPLSCPEDIKRFFVTPEQSGKICLLATFLGESGNVFFPKLDFKNDLISFKDIALDFLNKRNLTAVEMRSESEAKKYKITGNRYPIYFFKSDTSGEKTFEEFYTKEEKFNIEDFTSLGYIVPNNISLDIEKLKSDFNIVFNDINNRKEDFINIIKKYLPSFNHIETGKNLDQKM